jgi:hypothetical protein
VLRQRLEKVQRIIGEIEEKTLEVSVKFKVKAHEKCIKRGNRAELDRAPGLGSELGIN